MVLLDRGPLLFHVRYSRKRELRLASRGKNGLLTNYIESNLSMVHGWSNVRVADAPRNK